MTKYYITQYCRDEILVERLAGVQKEKNNTGHRNFGSIKLVKKRKPYTGFEPMSSDKILLHHKRLVGLEKEKRTTFRIPTWSPTVVLTEPDPA